MLEKFQNLIQCSYSNAHEMDPVSNFGLQNFPLHPLNILFAKFFNPQFL